MLWSNSATFAEDKTIVVEQGTVPWGSSTLETTITVPETTYGVNYIQFNRFGYDDPLSMVFMVKPHISVYPTSARSGDTVTITGTGFPANGSGILTFDGDRLNVAVSASSVGSFKVDMTVPQTDLGEHTLIVDTPLLDAETVRAVMLVVDQSSPPPPPPPPEPDPQPEQQDPPGDGGDPPTSIVVDPVSPPPSPAAIRPSRQSFGVIGSQRVTFFWNESPGVDDVTYTVEVARDFNFTTVEPSMRKTGLGGNSCTMVLEEGEYYWRVRAVDSTGNQSPWDTSAYAFQVGVLNRRTLMMAGLAVCILLILILLIKAVTFNHRYSRG